jgi:hypothetical protein
VHADGVGRVIFQRIEDPAEATCDGCAGGPPPASQSAA